MFNLKNNPQKKTRKQKTRKNFELTVRGEDNG